MVISLLSLESDGLGSNSALRLGFVTLVELFNLPVPHLLIYKMRVMIIGHLPHRAVRGLN